MDDIKLTLSTDSALRSPNIEAEAAWLNDEGSLWYPLGRYRPLRADRGCWVYFIRGGKLVARARAEGFDPPPTEARVSFTGETVRRSGWSVRVAKMELAISPRDCKGFQAFRYVTAEEAADFESAFRRRGGR